MNAVVGTGALIRLILRRDRFILLIWIVLLAIVVGGTAASFAQLYPTAESRLPLATTIMANPALSSLLGPLFDPSIGGLTAWRLGAIMSVIVGLVSLLTIIRHTRTEEETGRRELLGATVVGRHSPLSAALIVTCAADLVFALVVAAGLIGLGIPASGAIALGLAFAAVGWTFAAVASVAAQLTVSAGGARGIAILALGFTFLLRFLGDSAGPNGRLSWLSWCSPIGWAQRVRPFAGERWWIFALFAATSLVLAVAGYTLSARRDLGAGVLPSRLGRTTAKRYLRNPLALAWRLQSTSLLAWTGGFIAVGLMMGSAANAMADLLNTSIQLRNLFARIGGQAGLIDTFLSAIMGMAGLVAAAYAIQAALKLRSEEDCLRAELVLATSVGRFRWAVSHLVFAAFGPALVLSLVGIAAGLAYGLSAGEVARYVPRGLAAAIVQLPAVWVVASIAVALFGLLPRFVGVTWGILVAFLFLGELGPMLQLSQWMIDLSPFTHVPKVLIGEAAVVPLLWLIAVAGALTVIGLVGLRRRDLGRV